MDLAKEITFTLNNVHFLSASISIYNISAVKFILRKKYYMKFIKNNKILFLLFIIYMILGSCKKSFLDIENNSELYRQNYVKDLSSLQEYTNGIQVMLNRDFEHGIVSAYPDLVADNLKPLPAPPAPGSGTQSLVLHYTWSQEASDKAEGNVTETSKALNGYWINCYRIIRACSFVLEEADKYSSTDQDKVDLLKGHFKLVNTFAQCYMFTSEASHPGVPYITTSDVSKQFSRQTIAEVYDNIISDLSNAIKLFPSNATDIRYINQAASKALLARVYLFKEDYANAKIIATEICSRFPLMTIGAGYPNDLFKNKNPDQTEVLFQLTPMNLTTVSTITNFMGRYVRGSLLRYRATNDMATILKEYNPDARSVWVSGSPGLWNVTKFPTGVATGITPAISTAENSYYPPIIRSSEMYLTVAECAAKTGDENTARNYLDAIRKRAYPAANAVTATGSALMDSIYKERRKELAFEGFRMFDLQRWKLNIHRADALYSTAIDLPFPSNKAIAPIPVLDVKISGLLQNTGY
jgi:hypothetical protein